MKQLRKIYRVLLNKLNPLKNVKSSKKYVMLTGVYKLPRFAFGDIIRAAIISDEVFDNEIMEEIYKHLE